MWIGFVSGVLIFDVSILSQKGKVMTRLILALIVFGCVGLLFESGLAAQDKDKQAPIKISARDLMLAYKNNPKEAKAMYQGKLLEVTGPISSHGTKDIRLEGGTEFKFKLFCKFGPDEAKNFPELRKTVLTKGNSVTITGTCNFDSSSAIKVGLDNCKLNTTK